MRKLVVVIVMALLLAPSFGLTQGFYERESETERKGWLPFLPQEAVEVAFEETAREATLTAEDYRIEINVAARRLFLFERDRLVQTYPVAVGSNRYRTPIGPRYLKDITWNPWWFPPPYSDWAKGALPTPPGPNNPLGRVKMSLGGDILLHATNKEYTVGSPASHGCMRMLNKDAMELAWFLQTRLTEYAGQSEEELGALREKYRRRPWDSFPVKLTHQVPVSVIYERVGLWEKTMEIYPDIYDRTGDIEEQILEKLSSIGISPWDVNLAKLRELKKSPTISSVPIPDLLGESDI